MSQYLQLPLLSNEEFNLYNLKLRFTNDLVDFWSKNNKYNRTVHIKSVDVVKGDYNPDKIIKILNLKNFTQFNYKNITDISELNDNTTNKYYQRNFIEYVNNLDNIFDILEHYNKEFDKLYQNNNNKYKLQYSYIKEIYLTDTTNIMCENKFTKLREDIIKFKDKYPMNFKIYLPNNYNLNGKKWDSCIQYHNFI